ncbi:MAG: ribosomal L7Ae/L30e/S12e/Gadd45 family protein [Negativicoccus succinicivorans]|uniref:L7Ae/L30e/S12e/Gadd45 family ribosomal protein n=1 Tax=Negativicoccus succinicivorans TaxID=620903 RepID=UPI0023534EF9|nr:ribosomal L7Ae/L30e/S12e/Gadd45 family protein [Negativicoccus succinicivorans]MBS5889966.1 ribosomal L7Ae/L30e/S12e/Gadd45 family protein [Negativicoccus succinicivorans]MDU0986534.1 ribosomal L7Ae/L30e/S12e/Gadd45 family protein [Negativicoccus succinicivorans]MDU1066240.1 ribosomal L7Ae/L30e/S12e/Gadd45 family protein [Negativicoccus succinicivorans]MDU2930214.1 ribosomal L7Ae/L30e/S12e/Gadd45 family protein [Negativicoccus succinicivorans]MDU4203047.1 ribosomal L7Ae/L30e/S12e/Gadd45 fam
MSLEELAQQPFVVGAKEAGRAVRDGRAKEVWLAHDAQERITQPLQLLCQEQGVPVVATYSRAELGEACKLPVKAAAVAVLCS